MKNRYIIIRDKRVGLHYRTIALSFGRYGLCDSAFVYSMNKFIKKYNNNDNRQIFDASTIM